MADLSMPVDLARRHDFGIRLLVPLITLSFIPDFGISYVTRFGVLDPMDYTFVLAIALLLVVPTAPSGVGAGVKGWFWAFVITAYISTMLSQWGPDWSWSCFVKLGKYVLYTAFSEFLVRYVWRLEDNARLIKGLAVGACVVIGAVFYTVIAVYKPGMTVVGKEAFPYESINAVSVALASLSVFFALVPSFPGFSFSMRTRFLLLAGIFAGMLLTGGRAGWLGGIAGFAYATFVTRKGRKGLWASALLGVVGVLMFAYLTFVQTRFEEVVRVETMGSRKVVRIDDRARFETWRHELAKFPRAPVIGVGFYNRGRTSGLWTTGSHNFYIQTALETGFLGLTAFLGLLASVWKAAPIAGVSPLASQYNVAFRGALVAICTASLTGEYFYGGIALGTISILFGLTASFNRLALGMEEAGATGAPVQSAYPRLC